jgi:prepilin-type N-terminal cleavage/methylation domain-containing protein
MAKLNTKKISPKGFTLIELLISISIMILVMAMGYEFIRQGYKAITFNSEQEDAVAVGRRAMNIITKEIRGANTSQQGDYPLAQIESQDVIFYSDVDNDNAMEKIRYFRDNSILVKVITEPGPSNDYMTTPATTTLSLYLNNQEEPIFEYFDSNNVETSVINDIRLIRITLRINVTPWRAPNDYYLETDVSFRNLKSNL